MKVPSQPLTLLASVYRHVIPSVHHYLNGWKEKARAIPNEELRTQALLSIENKAFHCEGGGIYGLLAKEENDKVIRFIVAYQTISDYLDNLCDRSTSLDPTDFRALHDSMLHALTPGAEPVNYYRYRDEQDDGGYLESLVMTCQDVLQSLPSYEKIAASLKELAGYYCDLQVYKHVKKEDRVPLLEEWFEKHKSQLPEMTWYEFSACAGSTLGIFCLVSYAVDEHLTVETVANIKDGYFPWVQGLHILLDYFIDQEEDREGGDLNFCFYYDSKQEMMDRFQQFKQQADASIAKLPDRKFHTMINKGLLAIYLADEKVRKQEDVRDLSKRVLRLGGTSSLFFYLNSWVFRRVK
ncbi:tetraprenyl-beta-curcumene synthase family protein [Desertibacillus haloalkaliphilus]|uniref:tetraprenyl-beta-curcumene synthase family protein n=1 Tax=Desertibacillus haloalkaliphilus TaxID=1328930 RepID=UPI001C272A51|nr:tetraprenyl-beta-curcumene synthase family protein [Desertibacillus haloalkaliphilus]MBU8905287.1 tetraprenyl-beta-curcumene synthase family protein [Desertibacillus haloalkaliphilus]